MISLLNSNWTKAAEFKYDNLGFELFISVIAVIVQYFLRSTHLEALAQICYPFFQNDLNHLGIADIKISDESIYDTITNIAPMLNKTLVGYVWQEQIDKLIFHNPFNHFVPVLTGYGLCFALLSTL